ncbi:MAG: hypothetical protein HY902_14090 [Deltaproteobacteria bacterium]|nr:hypothetical protein [Deltaproteobacteria bacterium]
MTWDAIAALAVVAAAAGLLARRLWSPAPKCSQCPVGAGVQKPSQRKPISSLTLARKR